MTSGDDVAANLASAEQLIGEAAGKGASLVVLPENFAFLAADETGKLAIVEPFGEGPIQSFLAGMAHEHGVWLIGGTTPIQTNEPRRPASASLCYSPTGECCARYDKVHLFDVGVPGEDESYLESATAVAGEAPTTLATPCGRVGIAVCYDVRFPAFFDYLGRAGMDILALPAAFTVPTGTAHWAVLLRARAIESLCYVVAAAQSGSHPGGRQTYGHSMIVGPWGDVLAEMRAGPGVVIAELDLSELERLRERFPALAHRRQFDTG
jgi:predicted amidohydrolase